MRTYRIHTALLLGLFSFGALAAAPTATTEPPPLDYSRIIQQSNMVFVPYVGAQHGPIYYTQYAHSMTPASNFGDLRKITVHLRPTAHIHNQYYSFLSSNGITDAKVIPIPSLGTCKPTQEIIDMLSYMPDPYKPTIMGGNYPNICALSLYFLPSDETRVKDVINSRPVITMRATIPLCAATSPSLDVPAINQQLLAMGALTTTASGDLTGNSWDMLFESSQLALLNPSLFVTNDPKDGWTAYIKLFQVNLTNQTATMPAATAQKPYPMCTPAPLLLQFG
jgi:hypothetical protein